MSLRVLVADDDPDWVTILRRIVLRIRPDAEVVTARRGDDAIRLLDAVHAVVVDHRMPGATGDEVRAEAARRGIPAVIVSALGPVSHAGARVCVEKDCAHVREAVGEMLGRFRGAGRLRMAVGRWVPPGLRAG